MWGEVFPQSATVAATFLVPNSSARWGSGVINDNRDVVSGVVGRRCGLTVGKASSAIIASVSKIGD